MRKLSFAFIALIVVSCQQTPEKKSKVSEEILAQNSEISELSAPEEKEKIHTLLNKWHKAAGAADFEEYFGLMTNDAVFIGTDATENWSLEEFKEYSRPHFSKGKAWAFTPLERNIYLYKNKNLAWFDELLETHMGICRGSGVVSKEDGQWKIEHYVLSIEIPNENVQEVTELKKDFDKDLIVKLKQAKQELGQK